MRQISTHRLIQPAVRHATPGHGIDATRVAPNSSDLFLVRSTPPARARMGLYLTAPPVALRSQGRDSRHPVRTLPPPDGPKLEVAISLNQLHQVEGYIRGEQGGLSGRNNISRLLPLGRQRL